MPDASGHLVVWGHGNSWVVHRVNRIGRITWKSHWMSDKAQAEALLKLMKRPTCLKS